MTIESVKKESTVPTQNVQQKIMALLKIVEGISRSLNNLLERFHQSFFFYVIISSDRFISIGDYMPSIGLMAGSLLIKSFLLWLISNRAEDEADDDDEGRILIVKKSSRNIDVLNVGIIFLIAHLIGVAALFITTNKVAHDNFHSLNIPTQTAIFYLISIIFAVSLLAPKFLSLSFPNGQFLNIIVLLELGTMLLSVSMLNFSLGFFLCVVIVPYAICMNIREGNKRNLFVFLIKSAIHVLVHPLAIVYGVVLAMSLTSFPELNFNHTLDKSFKATVDGITYSVVDSLVSLKLKLLSCGCTKSKIIVVPIIKNIFLHFLDLRQLALRFDVFDCATLLDHNVDAQLHKASSERTKAKDKLNIFKQTKEQNFVSQEET